MVRTASSLLAAALIFATTLPALDAQKPNHWNLARLMSGDLPLPHDWAPKDAGLSASSFNSFSFDFTEAPSAVGTPAPSPTVTPPGPEVTPAPTEEPKMPVISIKLNMGGNAQQRLEAVNSILALIGDRLKVKGKAHKKSPNGVDDIANNGTAGANNGQGNNSQGNNSNNGQGNNAQNGNNGAPGNPSGTNETAKNTTAPTTSPGNNGGNGQGSGGAGGSGNNTSSTPSNGQGSNNGQNSPSKPGEGKPNRRQLDGLSSSRILQGTAPMALEEQGVLCVEGAEQEETDIDLENYAEEAQVRSLVEGMRKGSIPMTLADGTPVRDTVCHAETSMSMVAVPLSDPVDGSDSTGGDKKGSGLSTDYVILIAVLGGVVVLCVGIFLFRRRSAAARVAQI